MSTGSGPGDLWRWSRLGGWAIADQGFFATSNFALGVLLARWLSPAQFGAFAVAQSALLLFGALHVSLLTEPMLVFGPSRFAHRFAGYLGRLLAGHWLLTGGGALLFGLAALFLWARGAVELAIAMAGAALATPPVYLLWLARRAAFACLRPRYAALAGAGYLLLMVAGIALLYSTRRLSPFYAFLVLGCCGLVIGAVLIRTLLRVAPAEGELPARELVADHWAYGRWAVGSSTMSWISGNLYFFALPFFGGLAAAGAFRALLNLVLPMHQVIVALSMLLLPALVHARGTPRFRATLQLAFLAFTGAALVYWLVLACTARLLITTIYGGNYLDYAHLLLLAGVLPVIAALVAVVSNALRACERPDLVFRAYAGSCALTLTVGLWSVMRWQVAGAVLGELLSGLATVLVLALLHRRVTGRRAARAPTHGGILRQPQGIAP